MINLSSIEETLICLKAGRKARFDVFRCLVKEFREMEDVKIYERLLVTWTFRRAVEILLESKENLFKQWKFRLSDGKSIGAMETLFES